MLQKQKMRILLLVLLQLNCCLGFTRKLREECNDIINTSDCQCSPVLTDLEVTCPSDALNPSISVRIHADTYVQIECNKLHPNEYSLLPSMSVGNNSVVHIKQCPLPGHTKIVKIFDKLGITNVHTLIFESNNLDINLTRDHLVGLQNLGRLRFSSKSLTHLPEDLFYDMRNLTWLDLRWSNVELPNNIFAVLENLKILELGHNSLKYLPPGFFRNQHQLVDLKLWGNQLRNLTKDVFLGASSITDLELSANGIKRFQPDVFALLTNLRVINLGSNNFTELPEGLFAHNQNLTQFRLLNNREPLRKLPPGLLANLPQLREIRLTCYLETIPGDLFANSTAITNISITINRLKTLPADLLQSQYNLLDLDLQRNNLEKFPDNLFSKTTKLITLNLSQNQLTEISAYMFANLNNLQYLQMDNNHIKTIYREAFTSTMNLRVINMENNDIDFSEGLADGSQGAFGSPFQHLRNLQTLNLRNNSVMFIFQDWKYILENLRYLDLSYNNITSLSGSDLEFLGYNNVQVNLTHNQLHSVFFNTISTDGGPSPGKTLTLDLGYNPINCDCILLQFVQFLNKALNVTFSKRVKLDTDNLVCNNPPNLKGTLVRNVPYMQLLCPYENESSNESRCPRGCHCHIRSYDMVIMVNCSNSNLTAVPALPRLDNFSTELYIENSKLMKLPENGMVGYANVTKIFAANNSLSSLDTRQLPINLTYLDLRYNKLQVLNSSTLNKINASQHLNNLQLSHNPWKCTCDTKELFEFILRNPRILDFKQMQCYLPSGEIKFFSALSPNDFCPLEIGLIIAISGVISLMGFLIGLTAALYYKYEQEIKIFMYNNKLFGCFFPEEVVDKHKLFDIFISYSHKDEKFVADKLVKPLENINYTTCVHGRDWLPGECIPDNIDRAVDESRRTLVILSQNFIESSWSRMEFRNAHKKALEEKRARVVVIIYGDIDMENLDHELKAYLSMYTYLEWGEPWFWKKLLYVLPHRKFEKSSNGLVKNTNKGSTDDKLELIKPSPVTPPLTTPPAETTKNPLVAHLNGGTPQTAVMIPNGKMGNGLANYYANGKTTNGHINGAFIINTNAKQSDV